MRLDDLLDELKTTQKKSNRSARSRWPSGSAHIRMKRPRATTVTVVALFQFLVDVYGGYFGAGIGILMLSSLAFMGIADIHQMNG